ncbi:hypothetical protein [Sphingomonas xinjiangensis]|uniref:Uncharacterized protein n=1 Tax=Sphingomonas xinjiangensis TaxID=643568 RepID=A0A840YL54_9SPHN|nr:hypothetical protein [Sphingomonas xinjiangensis]MBB5709930.1 hypothetical protein [Sphingomonas xinjiangensis]
MANIVAVADRADTPPGRISAEIEFPYGDTDSPGERIVQGVSRWAGITAFFAALGALGAWLLG